MNVRQSPSGFAPSLAPQKELIADCDIHHAPKSAEKEIYPYLERRWVEYLETYGAPMRSGFHEGINYPKGQPIAARRDSFPPTGGNPGSDLDYMRKQHLDPHNIGFGVLIPLHPNQAPLHHDLSAALCGAINDWQVSHWTSQEPRLKASVAVPYYDPIASAKEVEKRAADRNFVQVSLLSRTPEPLGNRIYWPIYAAAQAADMPVGVHAFGYGGVPITGGGWPSYYAEEVVAHAQGCQAVVASMVLEGVFEQFPKLKLVIVEGGVSWLASTMWRLDKVWNRLRSELPHLKRPPSEYIREHVWVTSQPVEEPKNRQHFVETMDWIGWDRVMFASDYPHWDFDDPAHVVPPTLSKEKRKMFFSGNAAKVYGARNG